MKTVSELREENRLANEKIQQLEISKITVSGNSSFADEQIPFTRADFIRADMRRLNHELVNGGGTDIIKTSSKLAALEKELQTISKTTLTAPSTIAVSKSNISYSEREQKLWNDAKDKYQDEISMRDADLLESSEMRANVE